MLTRTLQRAFVVSTNLKSCKTPKNTSFIVPGIMLAKQQMPACVSLHFSAQCLQEEEKLIIPKDPTDRMHYIDKHAQNKIDVMMKENPEVEKLKQLIEMEITIWKQQGSNIPEKMRPRHWLELLKLAGKNQRRRYLEFLFKIEKKEENKKTKREKDNLVLEKIRQEREQGIRTDVMEYSIGKISMFRRISERSMNHVYNWNSLNAIRFGNKIVFDCSYEQYMTPQEMRSCAKQIMSSYSLNRQHNFPYHVYLCNVDLSGRLIRDICNFIPNLFDDDFPWTISTKSFMDLFDHSKVVYLSGHSNEVLQQYDCNAVYIIGAFVDKSYQYPVSLAKTKELGIKSVKLPLDQYIHFGDGSNKNLTLNQIIGIMLDAQCSDWSKALEHVPKRKLFESRLKALERKVEKSRFLNNQNKQSDDAENTISSGPAADFSYAARAKMRNSWNKD